MRPDVQSQKAGMTNPQQQQQPPPPNAPGQQAPPKGYYEPPAMHSGAGPSNNAVV